MTPEEVIEHYGSKTVAIKLAVTVKKLNNDKQIVYGEVYAPYVIDSHGDMMLPDAVEQLCHRFMQEKLNDQIDIMHDNKVIKASAVECYIAGSEDPVYSPGAWVLGTKVNDKEAWADIKEGKLNGYSMEALVYKNDAVVEVTLFDEIWSFTEEQDGHSHAMLVRFDDNGRVTGGYTSVVNGHSHKIRAGTATDAASGHSHRIFLV